MNLKLKEWNEANNYGVEVCEEMKKKGYNIKIKEYSNYKGDKGLYLQVLDSNNNLYTQYATGIHYDLQSMKNAIKFMAETIEEEV